MVTDLAGNVHELVGIAPEPQNVVLQTTGVRLELIVKPNKVWHLDRTRSLLHRAVPFDYPYQGESR